MNTENFKIKEKLFIKGIKFFNESDYYEAHEYWEELWSDFILKDKKFIQGLIQLSVAYFHITNSNKRGALSLFNKCKQKFEIYTPSCRGLDVLYILNSVNISIKELNKINDLSDFDWSVRPILEIDYERT